MTRKPHLVAANDAGHGDNVNERLAYALDRVEQAGAAQERRFLVDGELRPVHLPTDLWLVLDGIAMEEGLMTAHLVELVAHRSRSGLSLTAAIRAFILAFHRQDG